MLLAGKIYLHTQLYSKGSHHICLCNFHIFSLKVISYHKRDILLQNWIQQFICSDFYGTSRPVKRKLTNYGVLESGPTCATQEG